MAQSYSDQLDAVQTAITDILTKGQDVQDANGRRLMRANLEALQKREVWLLQRVAQESRGPVVLRLPEIG